MWRVWDFGIEDADAGVAKKAVSHPAGSSGKIHVFLSSGTELPDFSCFPAHLVAEAKIRCWKGSLVGSAVLGGVVGWLVL